MYFPLPAFDCRVLCAIIGREARINIGFERSFPSLHNPLPSSFASLSLLTLPKRLVPLSHRAPVSCAPVTGFHLFQCFFFLHRLRQDHAGVPVKFNFPNVTQQDMYFLPETMEVAPQDPSLFALPFPYCRQPCTGL
jgi:hypothetical protein